MLSDYFNRTRMKKKVVCCTWRVFCFSQGYRQLTIAHTMILIIYCLFMVSQSNVVYTVNKQCTTLSCGNINLYN